MPRRERHTYDYRIKAQVIAAGNPDLFPELEIPRSTAMSWIRRGIGDVVSLDGDRLAEVHLRERIAKLEGRELMLIAILRPALLLVQLSGFRLELVRIPNADDKRRLLGAIDASGLCTSYSDAFNRTIPRLDRP